MLLSKTICSIKLIFCIIVGIFLGSILSLLLFFKTSKILYTIDFDSGMIRQAFMFNSWVIHEESLESVFAVYPMKNGKTSLTGNEKWQKAFEFPLQSRISPNMKGGRVLYETKELGQWFPFVEKETASEVKEQYLHELALQGFIGQNVFNNLQDRLLSEIEKNNQSDKH